MLACPGESIRGQVDHSTPAIVNANLAKLRERPMQCRLEDATALQVGYAHQIYPIRDRVARLHHSVVYSISLIGNCSERLEFKL